MKAILALVTISVLSVPAFALDASRTIYCRAEGSNGNFMVTIEPQADGSYFVNDLNGGKNLSSDGRTLQLENLGFLCRGANATVDLSTGGGSIEYKYNSGALGGGCQHLSGTLVECNNQAWPQNGR